METAEFYEFRDDLIAHWVFMAVTSTGWDGSGGLEVVPRLNSLDPRKRPGRLGAARSQR